jgi:phenylpropionate dioxygenase-like ring-hydroxylating dioxygenase large terminal subunit
MLGDSTPPPAPLLLESPWYGGDEDVPYEEYTSAAWAAAEHEHVWSRTWQWACREEHLPEPGDYYVYDVGDRSAVVVRGPDGTIRAFHNACLHRGTQLKQPASSGFSPKLRCPFHGWTWDLDGTLVGLPCEWDFPHVDAARFRLPTVRTGQWGGFVFVNFADDAPPLEEYVGVLPEHFAAWDLADRYVEVHIRKRLPANWKAAMAAFLEAYHILETHPQSIYTAGDANAQYDVFGEHVSRFVHTVGTTSPHVPEADRPSEEALLRMLLGARRPEQEVPPIPPGQRARDVYARHVQQVLGERYDNDFGHLSVTETIDSIEYFLFPNAFFFPGLQIPLCYRFRPDGPDPDRCVHEVLLLRPRPRSGMVPPPAEPVDLDVGDSYTTVPGMPVSLARVLDQDTSNLAAQTRGFKASTKRGQTLGSYQESRTRHLHATVRRYLADGRSRR